MLSDFLNSFDDFKRKYDNMSEEELETDSVSAIFKLAAEYPTQKLCVLNFASYKKPGGMFLEGSMAQEEALCHESFLYNVLSSEYFAAGYQANKKELNRALYLNRAIYSPNILFERNSINVQIDVLTCPAPNYTAAKKFCNVSLDENNLALRGRIRFILNIMATNNVDIPILGAFGCGVFGQDTKTVATIFKEELDSGIYPFKCVIFAVIKNDPQKVKAFQQVFSKI